MHRLWVTIRCCFVGRSVKPKEETFKWLPGLQFLAWKSVQCIHFFSHISHQKCHEDSIVPSVTLAVRGKFQRQVIQQLGNAFLAQNVSLESKGGNLDIIIKKFSPCPYCFIFTAIYRKINVDGNFMMIMPRSCIEKVGNSKLLLISRLARRPVVARTLPFLRFVLSTLSLCLNKAQCSVLEGTCIVATQYKMGESKQKQCLLVTDMRHTVTIFSSIEYDSAVPLAISANCLTNTVGYIAPSLKKWQKAKDSGEDTCFYAQVTLAATFFAKRVVWQFRWRENFYI